MLEARWTELDDERRAKRVRTWAGLLLRSLGVRIVGESQGSDRAGGAAQEGATLVVANHRSMLDIPVLLSLTGGHMLSRGDIGEWPWFGRLAQVAGTVYVNRDDANSGALAIQQMRDLLGQRSTVCVFPEGTTFGGDSVRPFRPGAFVAAARAHASVVPLGIAYDSDDAVYGDETLWSHVSRMAAIRRIRVAIATGPRFSCRGLGVRELSRRAESEVQELVHRARRLLG